MNPAISAQPHGHTQPPVAHAVNYAAVFVLLSVLTVVTLAVSFCRFNSEWIIVLLAMTIATAKAALVAIYFMHLKFEGKLIYAILFLPVTLCAILVLGLAPDVVLSDPARHAASSSMHLLQPVSNLFTGLAK